MERTAITNRLRTVRVANGCFEVYFDGVKKKVEIINGCLGTTGRGNNIYGITNGEKVQWVGSLNSAKKRLAATLARIAEKAKAASTPGSTPETSVECPKCIGHSNNAYCKRCNGTGFVTAVTDGECAGLTPEGLNLLIKASPQATPETSELTKGQTTMKTTKTTKTTTKAPKAVKTTTTKTTTKAPKAPEVKTVQMVGPNGRMYSVPALQASTIVEAPKAVKEDAATAKAAKANARRQVNKTIKAAKADATKAQAQAPKPLKVRLYSKGEFYFGSEVTKRIDGATHLALEIKGNRITFTPAKDGLQVGKCHSASVLRAAKALQGFNYETQDLIASPQGDKVFSVAITATAAK